MKLVIELLLKWQTYLYMIQNMYLWFDTIYFVENNKIDLLNCKRFSFQAMTSWWKNRIFNMERSKTKNKSLISW